MERTRLDLRFTHHGSAQSEESSLDLEKNYCNGSKPSSSSPPLEALASCEQLSDNSAACFSWPATSRLTDAAEFREIYFCNLHKEELPETYGELPTGHRASTLLELMTIRAFHSKILRRCSLGTAVGFRIRQGVLTDVPAILVFVARKVNRQWLDNTQCLPSALEGPGGVWCDVDVVEFSYFGAPTQPPKEELYTELVDGLRGSDPYIGSGSQVASQETYGTLGAIVKSRTGNRQVGFLTNRHVAVNLDYPNQKMFHPLPPSLGPGIYLGAVERATSFITDEQWYDIYAGNNPETFVRADGAFIPFSDDFNVANVTTLVKGVGEIGDVHKIDLQSPVESLIGRRVEKVGRSSGLTAGTIMVYALEYNDEKGICFFTDFLVVGENQQTFDLEGDSGSLILLTGDCGDKPRPIGIIWGGTANRGRLKLRAGQPPENWTSGVDLGRLLNLLELELITTATTLEVAVKEQIKTSTTGPDSAMGESSPPVRADAAGGKSGPLGFRLQKMEGAAEPKAEGVEHQFISDSGLSPALHQKGYVEGLKRVEPQSLSSLRGSPGNDRSVYLQLGDPDMKKKKRKCGD